MSFQSTHSYQNFSWSITRKTIRSRLWFGVGPTLIIFNWIFLITLRLMRDHLQWVRSAVYNEYSAHLSRAGLKASHIQHKRKLNASSWGGRRLCGWLWREVRFDWRHLMAATTMAIMMRTTPAVAPGHAHESTPFPLIGSSFSTRLFNGSSDESPSKGNCRDEMFAIHEYIHNWGKNCQHTYSNYCFYSTQ